MKNLGGKRLRTKPGDWHWNFSTFLPFLAVVLIHLPTCSGTTTAVANNFAGQAANNLKKSALMDNMMQATQPHQCHALQPDNLDTSDKLVLSPIVFQGRKPFKELKSPRNSKELRARA